MTDLKQLEVERCRECGKFLAFEDLCLSKHHFEPLNEFGPEVSEWTGPCCRYRAGEGA